MGLPASKLFEPKIIKPYSINLCKIFSYFNHYYIHLQCCKQKGNEECGYFVMKHVFNVISSGMVDSFDQVSVLLKIYNYCILNIPKVNIFLHETLNSRFLMIRNHFLEDIDDVRRRWASYFLEVVGLQFLLLFFFCMYLMILAHILDFRRIYFAKYEYIKFILMILCFWFVADTYCDYCD